MPGGCDVFFWRLLAQFSTPLPSGSVERLVKNRRRRAVEILCAALQIRSGRDSRTILPEVERLRRLDNLCPFREPLQIPLFSSFSIFFLSLSLSLPPLDLTIFTFLSFFSNLLEMINESGGLFLMAEGQLAGARKPRYIHTYSTRRREKRPLKTRPSYISNCRSPSAHLFVPRNFTSRWRQLPAEKRRKNKRLRRLTSMHNPCLGHSCPHTWYSWTLLHASSSWKIVRVVFCPVWPRTGLFHWHGLQRHDEPHSCNFLEY